MTLTVAEIRAAFDHETSLTRRVLERVPDAAVEFRPHPRSWTLGELALHCANIPLWAALAVERDELDLAPPGGPAFPPPRFESAPATLRHLDASVERARRALAGTSDDHLAQTWTLRHGGHVLFALPRRQVLRSAVLDHGIHHRGQLTVYLRMCDVALPALYGPSADER